MVDDAWLETVRIARDCGDVSSLFPRGVTRLADMPYTLSRAIRMALLFLSWEELPVKEQPPRHMWLDADKLKAWFEQVKRDREDEMKGNGTRDMPQNALMQQIFGGKAPVG